MLNNLNLNNFGIHENLSIDFPEGINIIHGANRKGKTTILESICYALWGKTKNSTLERIITDGKKKTSVGLTFNDYLIKRIRENKLSKLEPGYVPIIVQE